MRLIDTRTITLAEFQPNAIPPYAILSHRWGAPEDEVLFQDMKTGTSSTKEAFKKISSACERAQADDLSYLWVDTCCIDKASSAELSEAINSMFEWYQDAVVCYAYLADISLHHAPGYHDVDHKRFSEYFATSSWFTRGWTLQELLAPKKVIFYDQDWNPIGTKTKLSGAIFNATGIGRGFIEGTAPITSASIAQRMSWSSKRQTTRPEDMAYSLLGIFSINMPLHYGEGGRAFIRLQEEILKTSDDHSLFAWSILERTNYLGTIDWSEKRYGLLASHPRMFRESGMIVPKSGDSDSYSMTNKGLLLRLKLQKEVSASSVYNLPMVRYSAALNCVDLRWDLDLDRSIAILLEKLEGDRGYARLQGELHSQLVNPDGEMRTIYVRQHNHTIQATSKSQLSFQILHLPSLQMVWSKVTGGNTMRVEKSTVMQIPKANAHVCCAMIFEHFLTSKYILVIIGSNFPGRLRLGDIPRQVTDIDLMAIAFDAHIVDDDIEASLATARAMYTPHTIGMTLFPDHNVAIHVALGWSHDVGRDREKGIVFDSTVPPVVVTIKRLGSQDRQPLADMKWYPRPICPADKPQEMPLSVYEEETPSMLQHEESD